MSIVIIRYNAGNTSSVLYALERLGVAAVVTDDAETILSADKIIFPGVGAAGTAMHHLRQTGLDKVIIAARQPLLGICLGMQILCRYSEEDDTQCLGVFQDSVMKFRGNVKVPHTGWNTISAGTSPLFKGIPNNAFMYFVHSYYVPLSTQMICAAFYDKQYTAALQKENFYGVQFHPEKSGAAGQQLIENFIRL